MTTSIKKFATSDIEAAFAKVLAEMTGKECSVSISEIKFLPNSYFSSGDDFVFSAKATLKTPIKGVDIPF